MHKKPNLSRRDLLRSGTVLGIAGSIPAAAVAAEPPADALYQSIGVSPVINARGTYTIITGSESLPQVKALLSVILLRRGRGSAHPSANRPPPCSSWATSANPAC